MTGLSEPQRQWIRGTLLKTMRIEAAREVLDALEAAEAREKALQARIGQCICGTPGLDYDGPDEGCPQHGRPYAEWVERSDVLQTRIDAALVLLGPFSPSAQRTVWGQQLTKVRSALTGGE